MKKLVSFMLVLILVLSFAGCGKKPSSDSTTGDGTTPISDSGDKTTDAPDNGTSSDVSAEDLSVDPLSFYMDGKKMSFPFDWTDIEDMVTYNETVNLDEDLLQRHLRSVGLTWESQNGQKLYMVVGFYNPEKIETPCSIRNAKAMSIVLNPGTDKFNAETNSVDLVIPHGIYFGDSVDKVLEAYGEPSYQRENDDGSIGYVSYSFDSRRYTVGFEFDSEGKVLRIDLEFDPSAP